MKTYLMAMASLVVIEDESSLAAGFGSSSSGQYQVEQSRYSYNIVSSGSCLIV